MNTTRHKMTLTITSDTEIVLKRDLDFPRDLVFEAFTKPEHIKNWWGCRNSTLTSCEMDFRPGGTWRFVTRMADGSEYPFKGEYKEIVRPERIVQTFIFDVEPFNVHESLESAGFTESDGKTTVTCTVLYDSIESRDAVIASGMEGGAAESYDRLEELLEKLA